MPVVRVGINQKEIWPYGRFSRPSCRPRRSGRRWLARPGRLPPKRSAVQPPRPDRGSCVLGVGRDNDRANAQTPWDSPQQSQTRHTSNCETREVNVTVKFDRPQFVSGDMIPSEFIAARISIRHAKTYLSIHDRTATVPFGYRRRRSQFGQVNSKARVSFSVKVIPCLHPISIRLRFLGDRYRVVILSAGIPAQRQDLAGRIVARDRCGRRASEVLPIPADYEPGPAAAAIVRRRWGSTPRLAPEPVLEPTSVPTNGWTATRRMPRERGCQHDRNRDDGSAARR